MQDNMQSSSCLHDFGSISKLNLAHYEIKLKPPPPSSNVMLDTSFAQILH